MVGHVVHTNELKVNIGGGYWVEMTAKEAEEYIQRCKTGELGSIRSGRKLIQRSLALACGPAGESSAHITINPAIRVRIAN
jgi:hypothetical protein